MTDQSNLESRVQAIEDRLAIQDVIIRYAHGVDRHDDDVIASCFTNDAQASFAGIPVGPGGQAIVSFLASTTDGPKPPSTHRFANVLVVLDGDEADVQSSAVVYGVRGEPEQLRLRGVNYQDRFRRGPDGWRISRRIHSVAWEGGAENVTPTPIRTKPS